ARKKINIILAISECACIIIFTMLPFWETEIHHEAIPAMQLLTNNKLRFIVTMTCALIAAIAFVTSLFFRNKSYKWISISFSILSSSLFISMVAKKVLKPYQVMRLIVFLDPSSDPQGAGWNLIQSKTAIGSGGFFGQGFLKGLLSHNKFLPEKSTDFIFSILSEETGFIGACIVIGLYLLMFIRILFVIRNTTTNYGYYISAGILGMIFFHFVVNVGMVMGIMPITGIPLLFLSYGGSSMWTAMICIGLLMSIRSRRLDFQDLI
ncbi:MAG: rod shape-determining protein RodA, partial [Treponema sp.]|nr:rod shape-determining protein RodA [Treponema sp.]